LQRAKLFEQIIRIRTEIQTRYSRTLVALVFVLVGIPLGIMVRRGHIVMAFAISFAVILGLFYPINFMGELLVEDGRLPAWAGLWAANAGVGGLGAALLLFGVKR
ncbi:MAG: LptF/LptG family permease, partial [Alphaproteobacteria bacterium]